MRGQRKPASASSMLPYAVGGQPTLPHLCAHLRQIIRASAVIDPHVRDCSPLIRAEAWARTPGARVLGGYSPALQACDTLFDGGIDDDNGVKTVSVVALDEERNVVDGKRSCGCSVQDLPGATLDGRVGDRVESSDALVGSLTGEDTTREARPVKVPSSRIRSSPNRAATCTSAGRPGSRISRAITSASATSAPRDLKEAVTEDLPEPIPPLTATTRAGPPLRCWCSGRSSVAEHPPRENEMITTSGYRGCGCVYVPSCKNWCC